MGVGPECLPQALEGSWRRALRDRVTAMYRGIDSGRLSPADLGFVPSSSSFPLQRLLPVEALLRALHPSVIARLQALLGPGVSVDVDIAWVRRQFAPAGRPAGAHPHSWHQDGAWGCDFLRAPQGEALLPMQTLWIAPDDCGVDAPGLEFVDAVPARMLTLEELQPARVEARYGASRRRRPRLRAGDALLFGGSLLHRTHVDDGMTRTRHSIELRFVDGARIPARLAAHRFLPVRDSGVRLGI